MNTNNHRWNGKKNSFSESVSICVHLRLKTFLAGVCCLLFLSGCQTDPTRAFNTETAIDETGTALMATWDSYVEKNRPSIALEKKVNAAWEKYNAALLLAVDISRHYAQFQSPHEAEDATKRALISTAEAFADLTVLIQTEINSAVRQSAIRNPQSKIGGGAPR